MAPSALQIIVIVLLVMVLFGTGRIPVIMENIAKGINSFKKGLKEEEADVSDSTSASPSVVARTSEPEEAGTDTNADTNTNTKAE
ncbi:MAG: twin-arginine translocase TatA/TatE family subunit [Alphaproteobacteria bacterium]|nr:twin-arginine translocase TatA/TatE family subunit [Alphaproteobacteria bacterium]